MYRRVPRCRFLPASTACSSSAHPAANDSEAIAQAEALHGSLAAELRDFDGLRVVKRLPPNGKASSEAAE
jgi:hypothetical protein